MPIEKTRITKRPAEDLHHCPCGALASHSCTDAVQSLAGDWTESEPRYGCAAHPVRPMLYFIDSRVITAEEYEATR